MQISAFLSQFVNTAPKDSKKVPASSSKQPQTASAKSTVSSQPLNQLQTGQTFEGNVSSVKGDKVTLALSNGDSVVARLSENISLSEGESVFFEVKSNDGNLINIRPVSVGIMANPTILSALSAGGLAESERNIQMVHSMMGEQLPIDAKSLGEMARHVAAHPDTEVGTLVTMQKAGIPLTDEMIQQFENYSESEGAILKMVSELVDGVAESFLNDSVSQQDISAFAKNLMSILNTEEGVLPELTDAEGNPIIIIAEEGAVPEEFAEGKVISEEAQPNTDSAEADSAEADTLKAGITEADTAESDTVEANTAETVLADGEADTAAAKGKEQIAQNESKDNKLVSQNSQTTEIGGEEKTVQTGLKEEYSPENTLKGGENLKTVENESNVRILSSADDPELSELLKNTPGREDASLPDTLGKVLDSEGREELTRLLKDAGLSAEGLTDEKGVLKSEIGTKELMQAITEHLSENHALTKEDMLKMLSSEPLKRLLKDVMSQKWTLPPEKVADKEAVKEFYAKLSVDMERLSKSALEAAKGQNPISTAAQSIKNNVDFINQINQAYNYIQLPLKLSGQNATGDLYVYSNKKGHIGENDELSAFLHFDLDHLGSTDISVKMKQKKVSTNFYMEDEASFALVEKNLPILQEKLEKLGYSVSLSIEKGDETVDFVEDFIKQDVSFGGDVRRYSFDMMA